MNDSELNSKVLSLFPASYPTMWFSFWRSRNRFTIDELRYLTEQLQKIQVINEVNKDLVIEALRSIAELITYGDQHDSSFFEFFMEKQVMGEFVRILKISRILAVSIQLLQTLSIMIQNLKNEHAIYYMFRSEHTSYLITYAFDFQNEELLSYYISFLRAISGKLNKNTISLLLKTQNDQVVSFPLYVEAIRFAFHEESMIRTAVRNVTLNVYHVGDDGVNRYVTSGPHAGYFSELVMFLRKQCVDLDKLVSKTAKNLGSDSTSAILGAVDEIEDNLYYMSDVISAGIPDVGVLITDSILLLLIFPLLLPSLKTEDSSDICSRVVSSLYLLCCILRIVKIKDLANTIAAALFFPPDAFLEGSVVKVNGYVSDHDLCSLSEDQNVKNLKKLDSEYSKVNIPQFSTLNFSVREALVVYLTQGDDTQVLGSLSVLATLLQTKELDESMLDALGILPQRMQHKKLLLQALAGEASGEEQLFSSESSIHRDAMGSELDFYFQKIKDQYGVSYSFPEVGLSPRAHRFQVIDALVGLFCRANVSAETLWDGGWLLRQLLPYSETEFKRQHLELLNNSYKKCSSALIMEVRGIWPDQLITVLCDEWRKCKRAIESSSPQKEPKSILLPRKQFILQDDIPAESSFTAGERMSEVVKVFVLLQQLQLFTLGRVLPEQPPIHPARDESGNSRATISGLDVSEVKPGSEIRLEKAVSCRIAFERGKERHVFFLTVSKGTSGRLVLAEELPLKQYIGVIRVTAPLAGCNPRVDDKHSRWLHLRIRPSTLPFLDPAKSQANSKMKTKSFVDGRWTLAFRDEESCNSALTMTLGELNRQSNEVERRLKPLINLGAEVDPLISPFCPTEVSKYVTPSNSL